jgi:hypothetical protein
MVIINMKKSILVSIFIFSLLTLKLNASNKYVINRNPHNHSQHTGVGDLNSEKFDRNTEEAKKRNESRNKTNTKNTTTTTGRYIPGLDTGAINSNKKIIKKINVSK